jgi:hypothetical protein
MILIWLQIKKVRKKVKMLRIQIKIIFKKKIRKLNRIVSYHMFSKNSKKLSEQLARKSKEYNINMLIVMILISNRKNLVK